MPRVSDEDARRCITTPSGVNASKVALAASLIEARRERDEAREALSMEALVANGQAERARKVEIERDALRAECDDLHRAIDVLRDECARLRVIEQAALAERDRAMAAAQLGVAQCAQVQDALRRVLPMAEAWFRREFDGLCDHEPGECHCDREAHARTDINIALAALGKGKT
jgi:hypothetical protein